MSLKACVLDTVFGGRQDPLNDILVQASSATSPNGVKTALIGTFYVMDYPSNACDNDVYINTDGSTAWTLIYDASSRGTI